MDMNIIQWQTCEKDDLQKIINYLKIEKKEIFLTNNDKVNENILQNSVNCIRTQWIQKVFKISSTFCGSPWRGMNPCDTDGEPVFYTYGTLVDDSKVATNLTGYTITNRLNRTYIYDNGMSAIRGTIEIINSFIREPIRIQHFAGYFETRIFFETLKNCGITVNETNAKNNVFFFEPIQYRLDLPSTDINFVIDLINKSDAKVKFIIIDSTMDCSTTIFEVLRKKIKKEFNVVFIDLRSGIKQDQFGLEFENIGIVTWHVHKKNISYAENLFQYIKHYKNISGENISYNKLLLVSKCEFQKSMEYKLKLQYIVQSFMDTIEIKIHKYILEIISPKTSIEGYVSSIPFIFVKFNLSSRESYEQLLNNFINCCLEDQLFLPYRNSFGFRYPSIEFICDYETKECVMKFGLGVYKGALYEKIFDMISALGSEGSSKIKKELTNNISEWR